MHDSGVVTSDLIEMLYTANMLGVTSLNFTFTPLPQHRELFKHCSAGRLLMPRLFPDLDVVVYLDADVYVDDDLTDLVGISKSFTAQQWAAVAYETYKPPSWYTLGRTNGDYVKPFGINSGVMVVDLRKVRNSAFESFWPHYDGHMPLGDQDLFNAYFAQHMNQLRILPCKWNRCIESRCDEKLGKYNNGIVHGNKNTFFRDYDKFSLVRYNRSTSYHYALSRFESFGGSHFLHALKSTPQVKSA
eukprot:6191786-Pleurochrysis_carterae.AAC.1